MTDHKYTDQQIIKALEVCIEGSSCKECPINPNHGNYGYCTNLALTYALDLINRQRAEIERLKKLSDEGAECPTCHGVGKIGTTNWLTKDLSKKQIAKEKAESVAEFHRELKAEAVKEFAERLKKEQEFHVDECDRFVGFVAVSRIDKLVEEIAGGANENIQETKDT